MTFTDNILSLKNDHFIRKMDNDKNKTEITYLMGEEESIKSIDPLNLFLKTKDKDKSEAAEDFITLDLETQAVSIDEMSDKANLRVVSAVFYDGKNINSYFLNDYKDSDTLIEKLIEDLLNNLDHNKKRVYVHNLSGFDAMFLIKTLANYRDFKIIKKDDTIISLSVSKLIKDCAGKYIENNITFIDSLNLLPSSLANLGKAFGVSQKGDFDHNRTNKCKNIQDFELIRNELIKYNTQDCIVLHDVLKKFGKLIFELFEVNIEKKATVWLYKFIEVILCRKKLKYLLRMLIYTLN